MNFENEPMLEVYIFETTQNLEQLEQVIIYSEKNGGFSAEDVSEIFRFMHTIKGSSAMMLFNNIEMVAHSMEDIFYFIREQKPEGLNYSAVSDLVLACVDFIKEEIDKIIQKNNADGDPSFLIESLKLFLDELRNLFGEEKTQLKDPQKQQYYISQEKKQPSSSEANFYYHINVSYEDDCMMENIRAYTLIFGLTELVDELYFFPADITENSETAEYIRENGFDIYLKAAIEDEELEAYLNKILYIEKFSINNIDKTVFDDFKKEQTEIKSVESFILNPNEICKPDLTPPPISFTEKNTKNDNVNAQKMISVNVDRLDNLMNLVGELMITESMVTQCPEVEVIESENFHKASIELHKITEELQDMVMSIRMVPLSTTFVKMNRIVRDMCKKLTREVILDLHGEETEVDKNIIEHISDPLMHIIRNAIDHGIENESERLKKGKEKAGRIILEAKNIGSDVLIIIKDDGRGLDKIRIIEKAQQNGLLTKSVEEMSDREIFKLILLPGFSTNESVTEFSGRGVGMDVVTKNIEAIGGTVLIDSEKDKGTIITLKIPLTLAIVEGMNIRVGRSRYTIPINTISESFRPEKKDCIIDPDDNEMVMIRGVCYPILRLHQYYHIKNAETDLTKGILIMVEQEEKVICIFADELLGQQQVVVKALPNYVNSIKNILGLAGCTLLPDGSISLIMDISGLTGLRIM
ncbi:chemotaxis protein CheA [Acetobacterium woodii]|uniref:Chemotaxis protein CheA n=1 Tax=Acetobacterium woodii (strain ATCC 29683 / DSM 1030 / JCM 2381 / KCTC 1655 / WB1) TaxID=931626 RepID=H6LJA9_ACEWD|nr:chemotaxis protein CheA [Acetobacterium woodii]AFA48672.1 chemotaxis protein histidine kinase CheA3 [Acetobacterium woodii DSM 1030]